MTLSRFEILALVALAVGLIVVSGSPRRALPDEDSRCRDQGFSERQCIYLRQLKFGADTYE